VKENLISRILSKNAIIPALLVASFIAIFRFINILPVSIVNPFNYRWMQNDDGALLDLAQSNTAQHAFSFQKNWNVNGQISNLGSDLGNVLLFSDANPIFSYFLRVVVWLTGLENQPLQFVGIEILLAILLLAWSVQYFVLKETRNIYIASLATVVCLFAPQIPLRVWAPSVMFQFLIVLSFILFRREEIAPRKSGLRLWALLGFLCAGINTYFVPMVFVVLMARIIGQVALTKRFNRPDYVFGFIAGVVLGHYISGGFSAGIKGGKTGTAGVGPFSADLLSLFDSGGISRWWPDLPSVASFEGYSYLGVSSLILALIATVRMLKNQFKNRVYWATEKHTSNSFTTLFVACLFLYLFAVGPAFQIRGDANWITQDPTFLEYLSIFHSSGRFVLPLLYFLILVPIIYLSKNLNKYFVFGMLLCCSVTQIHEFSNFNVGTYQRMNNITQVENDLLNPLFVMELEKSKFLEFIPSSPTPDIAPWRSYFLEFLSDGGTVTNFAYMNRYDKERVIRRAIETKGRVLNSELDPDFIYIISNEELGNLRQNYLILHEFEFWKAIKIKN
jgi:hypothetical protein